MSTNDICEFCDSRYNLTIQDDEHLRCEDCRWEYYNDPDQEWVPISKQERQPDVRKDAP